MLYCRYQPHLNVLAKLKKQEANPFQSLFKINTQSHRLSASRNFDVNSRRILIDIGSLPSPSSALHTPELLECNPHSNPIQFLECNPRVTPTIFLECNPHSTPQSNPKFSFWKNFMAKTEIWWQIRNPNQHCINKDSDEFIFRRLGSDTNCDKWSCSL